MANSGSHRSFKQRTSALLARFRNYTLAGVLVTAPIAITLWLAITIINLVDDLVRWVLGTDTAVDTTSFWVPGLGLVIVIAFLALVGFFTASFLGRVLIRLSDYAMSRMPVIRTVYGALKQILETVLAKQSEAFREVAMLEYPRKDVWSLGFVTGPTKGEIQTITGDEMINVFVPTTPNPTSGYLLFVPRSQLVILDMSIDDAIKLVVSGGIVAPPTPTEVKGKVRIPPAGQAPVEAKE